MKYYALTFLLFFCMVISQLCTAKEWPLINRYPETWVIKTFNTLTHAAFNDYNFKVNEYCPVYFDNVGCEDYKAFWQNIFSDKEKSLENSVFYATEVAISVSGPSITEGSNKKIEHLVFIDFTGRHQNGSKIQSNKGMTVLLEYIYEKIDKSSMDPQLRQFFPENRRVITKFEILDPTETAE